MNLFKFIIPIICVGLLNCSDKTNEVYIVGKISGEVPQQLYFTLPFDGICNSAFKDSIDVDLTGNFEINFEMEQASFVKVILWGKGSRTFLVEKGKTYQLEVNTEIEDNMINVVNQTKEVQDAIDLLNYSDHIQLAARKMSKNSTISSIKKKIETEKESELNTFKQLLSDAKISEDFYRLVKIDRDCYYAALSGTIALIKKYEDLRKENGSFTEEHMSLWQESFQDNPLSNEDLLRSPRYYDLAENYIHYTIFTDPTFSQEELKDLYEDGLIHTYYIEKSREYLSSDMLEYYNAVYLFKTAYQMKYEEELISLYYNFKSEFAHSKYSPFIEPLIEPIIEFHRIKKQSFHVNTEFIEGMEDKNTLYEVIESLQGKKLYVDVWATWCGPCKEEFAYKTELYSMLKKYDVEVLYISIDEEKKEEQWLDMIKFYNLEGYHIRANKKLDNNLRKLYTLHEGIAIPWYMLVDENGKVKVEFASKPSEIIALEKELKLI